MGEHVVRHGEWDEADVWGDLGAWASALREPKPQCPVLVSQQLFEALSERGTPSVKEAIRAGAIVAVVFSDE